MWPSRLRWRLRGAWMWPSFALFTLADAAVLHALPPFSEGFALIPAIIVSGFANLFLVGAAAPWFARRLRARQGVAAAPLEIVVDRAGTGLLAAGCAGVLAACLASQPLIVSETEATETNARLVRDYVLAHGTPEVRRNLETANTIRLGEGFFRTCVALDDRRRAFCMFVETNTRPPRISPDPNPDPNRAFLARDPAN